MPTEARRQTLRCRVLSHQLGEEIARAPVRYVVQV